MADIFSKVSLKKPRANRFNLSYENKLSCNLGQLIPIMCQDVIPGDYFKVSTEHLIRLAPLVAPMMHRLDVFIHYFFVPNRLIWDDFESFITGGLGGREAPIPPYVDMPVNNGNAKKVIATSSLADYLGFPVNDGENWPDTATVRYSQLPFRAYNLIYNEYYKDQNVLPLVQCAVPKGSGSDLGFNPLVKVSENGDEWIEEGEPRGATWDELMSLRERCWRKDYFTSALPFAQRGPRVRIPITFTGELTNDPSLGSTINAADGALASNDNVAFDNNSGQLDMDAVGSSSRNPINIDVTSHTKVSVLQADGTINDLRRSIKVQEWLERSARGGSRYIEQIYSHFGVKGDDYRLQRPVYLGGGKAPIVVSPVEQTSASDSVTPQANLAGMGTSLSSVFGFKRYFNEHGWVLAILSILPKASYFQGMPRKFDRQDKFDYFFPTFAHIGEQAIKNKEIFFDPTPNNTNDDTFGYTPRYAEYRFNNDEVHGSFRTSLDSWHMARKFANMPALSAEFLQVNDPSLYRVFAVTTPTVEHFYCQFYHNITAKRLIPRYGTPSI